MKKRGESGFALLLVFLMAAVIAITLYRQIPRVAFQAQRQKEQMLIERGEQYRRAIQLFVRANRKYPSRIEDLENFNNRRFLRHRYKDPMTGKDDWRLIHINAAGVFEDSLLNKPKEGDKKDADANANSYVAVLPSIGSTTNTGQPAVPGAVTRRRASEGGANPAIGPDGQPIPGSMTVQTTGIVGVPPGQQIPGTAVPGQPQPYPGVQPYPGAPPAGVPTYPGVAAPPQGSNPAAPSPFPVVGTAGASTPFGPNPANVPGIPNVPGSPVQGRTGFPQYPGVAGVQAPQAQQNAQSSFVGSGQSYVGGAQSYVGGGSYVGGQPTGNTGAYVPPTAPVGGMAVAPGYGQPAGFPSGVPPQGATAPGTTPFPQAGGPAGPNAATQMIMQGLMGPRPGGAPGQPAGQPMGQTIGAGIAGVASKSEDPAIMVYDDRTNYNEWEFLYDVSKDQSRLGPNGGGAAVGTPAANLGSMQGAAPGVPAAPGASPMGASPVGTSLASSPAGVGASPFGGGGIGAAPIGGGATSGPGTPAAGVPGPGTGAAGQLPAGGPTPQLPPNFRMGQP